MRELADAAAAVADAAAAVGDLLVPARCRGCGSPGSWLCHGCRGSFEPIRLAGAGIDLRGAGPYEDPLRAAIHRFKYRDERGLANELGELVAGVIAADLARGGRLDAIVPVPLHRDRARARGYDQAAMLAAEVAERAGLPLRPALDRIRGSRPQVDLDRAERARNVDGAFVAAAGSLRGLRVALVDDVATTGATCRAAARAARAAGARDVLAYVVAVDE